MADEADHRTEHEINRDSRCAHDDPLRNYPPDEAHRQRFGDVAVGDHRIMVRVVHVVEELTSKSWRRAQLPSAVVAIQPGFAIPRPFTSGELR